MPLVADATCICLPVLVSPDFRFQSVNGRVEEHGDLFEASLIAAHAREQVVHVDLRYSDSLRDFRLVKQCNVDHEKRPP